MTKPQHLYEIEAAHSLDPGRGERSAVGLAESYLAEHADVTSVGLYHSYPNAGPQRRFVREITRS